MNLTCAHSRCRALDLAAPHLTPPQATKTSARENTAGGKNKAGKTLGTVNVKQIIKYGEITTGKQRAEAAYADRLSPFKTTQRRRKQIKTEGWGEPRRDDW